MEDAMHQNVGRTDQLIRIGVGSALVFAGIGRLARGRRLAPTALLAGGAVLLETAVTRTCPINHLLGLDTRRLDARERNRGQGEVEHYADVDDHELSVIDESLPNPFPHAVPFQTNAASGPPSSTSATTAPGVGTSPMGSMRAPGDTPSVVGGDPTGGATAPPSER
jgi:hypothetical protein